MRTFTIIGLGKAGKAFAIALETAGYGIQLLVTRNVAITNAFADSLTVAPRVLDISNLNSMETDVILIATQDSEIKNVAERLAQVRDKDSSVAVIHLSGAFSSEELVAASGAGYSVGSMHPLLSLTDPQRGADGLKSAYFAIEGDPAAKTIACEIVNRIGGSYFEIDTAKKSLYHAAAVVACGHLTALIYTSQKMLKECGLTDDIAAKIMMPLVFSTIQNIADDDPVKAFTGPFQRLDKTVISEHLKQIGKNGDASIGEVYRILGKVSLELAGMSGADPARIREIQKDILLD